MISGWKAPTGPPPPHFSFGSHPVTLHLDVDERFGDLWRLALQHHFLGNLDGGLPPGQYEGHQLPHRRGGY